MNPKSTAAPSGGTAPRLISLVLVTSPLPLLVALILAFQRGDFDPAPLPASNGVLSIGEEYDAVLGGSERVGGGLLGPEDLAYDEGEGVIYAGCYDGWVRKFWVKDGKVEDWVRVGGRPLGVALAPDGSVVVAEPYGGLLKVNKDGEVDALTDVAEGKKFKLTDGVDVASNGIIYFTDASYKYSLDIHLLDILEGRPYGRLLSFDPSTNQTTVLLRELYFANGVAVSPDQQALVFCETPLRRCRRHHIEGERKGRSEVFVENLPGFPDNIRYDGDGHYLIGLAAGRTLSWDLLMKYPLLRKLKAALGMHVNFPSFKNSGLMRVDVEGKPVALYKDPELSLITGGLKLGNHLYLGSLSQHFLLMSRSLDPAFVCILGRGREARLKNVEERWRIHTGNLSARVGEESEGDNAL